MCTKRDLIVLTHAVCIETGKRATQGGCRVWALASPAMGHWTGVRAPSTSNYCLIFQVTSEPHKLTFDSIVVAYRVKIFRIIVCHCLLHEFHNIFVCHP